MTIKKDTAWYVANAKKNARALKVKGMTVKYACEGYGMGFDNNAIA